MLTTGPMGTIVLVDDDANITDLLKFNLSSEGYGVNIVPFARDVDLQTIPEARMVIVDAMNQKYTGIDLARDIKSNPESADVPVIVCSPSEGEDLIVEAFDNGADDFIPKPFSLRELIARVRAIMRRHPQKAPTKAATQQRHSLSVPALNLMIDLASQKVIEDGIVVPLTRTEYAILVFLMKNQNSFFTRQEICREVWKDEASDNARVVDTNISRLRRKLGETGKYIINRYGMGYAFVDKLS